MGIRIALTSAAVALMIAGSSQHRVAASSDLPVLGDAKSETLSPKDMANIRGGVLVGSQLVGNYFLLFDNALTYPLGFDTSIGAVQNILIAAQQGSIPNDLNTLATFLSSADPQGLTRFSPLGMRTPNGPCIPGFTVGPGGGSAC